MTDHTQRIPVHCLAFCLTVLFAIPVTAKGSEQRRRFADAWVVILGSYTTESEARLNQDRFSATLLNSTYYSGLTPGWYTLVQGPFESRGRADERAEALSRKGIRGYVKRTSHLASFDIDPYRIGKLSEQAFKKATRDCFRHKNTFEMEWDRTQVPYKQIGKKAQTGQTSPDGSTSLSFKRLDPTADIVMLHKKGKEKVAVEGHYDRLGMTLSPYVQTMYALWSKDSRHVVLVDVDEYAGGGAQSLFVLDVKNARYRKILLEEMVALLKKRIGKRENMEVTDMCWMAGGQGIVVELSVDYPGSSGHPGIDAQRESEGHDLGRSNPVDVGGFIVAFEPGFRF